MAPSAANDQSTGSLTSALDQIRVSERLAAIREAVSAVFQPQSRARPSDGNLQLAWGNRWKLSSASKKAVVGQQPLANLFSQVFASGCVRDSLSVVRHSGEPTVLPLGFYCDMFRTIHRLKPADLTVAHSFPTSGTLIAEAEPPISCSMRSKRHNQTKSDRKSLLQ